MARTITVATCAGWLKMGEMTPLLILGATGQIGTYLLARTVERHVVALARDPDRLPPRHNLSAHVFAAAEDLPSAAAQAVVTIPVWLVPGYLDRLADSGVRRLVCFSTTSVLGKADSQSRRERAVVARVAGAEAQLKARADDLDIALTVLRPTMIYGTGRDQTIAAAARFIQRFGWYPVHGAAMGARQPVHAADLAAAALAAMDVPGTHGRVYALGGGETLAYREMISRIFAALGRPARTLCVPFLPQFLGIAGAVVPGSELSADVARRMNLDLAFDDGSAAADFGYAPRGFLAGGREDLFGPGG